MKNLIYLMIFVLSIGFTTAINGFAATDAEIATELWGRLQSENYRRKWEYWPGKGNLYKGTHPHGALLTTYVNDIAFGSLLAGDKELAYGSVIVKENYMPNKIIGAVTVMERIKGYNPKAGDWFWVKFGANGEVLTKGHGETKGKTMSLAGKVPGCIGCHTASAGGIKYIMTK